MRDVRVVGKIDRKIYRCISADIATDEVIITEERIAHIRERHPNDYERFSEYFSSVLSEPDYIIEARKPDTAVVLKEVVQAGEKFQLVMKLVASESENEKKNSIITFMKISVRTWKKYLRNKKILYKREI